MLLIYIYEFCFTLIKNNKHMHAVKRVGLGGITIEREAKGEYSRKSERDRKSDRVYTEWVVRMMIVENWVDI